MASNSFPRQAVVDACQKYGPQLRVDSSLDGVKVALAIASNESSVGANCGPRHEPAYEENGSIWKASALQQQLVEGYGPAAAASYGPWQMMFINFERGIDPGRLLTDLECCAENFVRFFNSYVIGIRKAVTLEEIGQVWNGGHKTLTPSPAVKAYCEHLASAYARQQTVA